MEKLVNLTPHPVTILSPECAEYNARTRSYQLKGEPQVLFQLPADKALPLPRVSTEEVELSEVQGVPTISVQYGEIENLPEQEEGTFFVVSALAANAARERGRKDVLVPARMVREADGRIVGCLALAM